MYDRRVSAGRYDASHGTPHVRRFPLGWAGREWMLGQPFDMFRRIRSAVPLNIQWRVAAMRIASGVKRWHAPLTHWTDAVLTAEVLLLPWSYRWTWTVVVCQTFTN